MKNVLKKLLNKPLKHFGYRIADERNIHDETSLVQRLKEMGFRPQSVVDVGVAHGTPYLYHGFPDAHFFLFDPTEESLPHMKWWAEKIDAEVFNIALGAEDSTMKIKTRDTIQHATLLEDTTKPELETSYDVEVKQLDNLDITLTEPCLAKIDVEGFELDVLKGMRRTAKKIDLVIIETSLASLYNGGASTREILNFMDSMDFRPVDIAGITRRPRDNMIHQIDFVFARKGTAPYAKSWS